MSDWFKDSNSFNTVADDYDAFRPGYPREAIDYIFSTVHIPEGGRILEIGSGTGIATLLLAPHGYAQLCTEPGANLTAIARQKLQAWPQVMFTESRYEAWDAEVDAFDLAVSATAFHWLPEAVKYAKTAQALRSDGTIALFWNMSPMPHNELYTAVQRVYRKYATEFVANATLTYEEIVRQRAEELDNSGYFKLTVVKRFPWTRQYDTRQYIGLLHTFSDHLRLARVRQELLFAEIAGVIDRFGGIIEKPYETIVYLGEKKSLMSCH